MFRETLFDRVLVRVARWREAVDRERDLVATSIAAHGATPMLRALLDELEAERVRVLALHQRLEAERNEPALLLSMRPRRALKAGLQVPLPPAKKRMS
jgi:hypothetical protein